MAGNNYFAALKNPAIAQKECKFQQRASMSSIPQGGAGHGLCLAVSFLWIKEKISHHRLNPLKIGQNTFSSKANQHDYNSGLMMKAYRLQQAHYVGKGGHTGEIERALGLHSSTQSSVIRPTTQNLSTLMASKINILTPGTAIAFELRVEVAGAAGAHMVAVYKSRGNKLHFFDPNVGIYEVKILGRFLDAWQAGCRNRGWSNLQPYTRGSSAEWTHVFQRAS
jgi:hypothetical protein